MMLSLTSNEEHITKVTLANDDGEQIKAIQTFQYNLNTSKTRKLLCEGAMRSNYQREEKKGCINLVFNDGSYTEVVLKALIDLQNGPKHFIVGKEEIERVSIDPREELSEKHVDTMIEFRV